MSNELLTQALVLLTSFIASQGFWTFINNKFQNTTKLDKLVKALVRDRLTYLCEKALRNKSLTSSEYSILIELYDAYRDIGGNGTIAKLMAEIEKLELDVDKENT
jgi:hypothetical protein